MKWKKTSNFIIAAVLSIAYFFVTLLNIIGPLHTNATGAINTLGSLSTYSLGFLIFSLLITWCMYFALRKKPEMLFFLLIILGIVLIIVDNFMWGAMGS